jgi:hypothetical protein
MRYELTEGETRKQAAHDLSAEEWRYSVSIAFKNERKCPHIAGNSVE